MYVSNPSSANFHNCTFQSTGSSQMFIQASTKDIVTFSGQTVMPTSIKENDALYTNVDASSPPPPPLPPALPPPLNTVPPPPWPPGTTSWTSWATYARGAFIKQRLILLKWRMYSVSPFIRFLVFTSSFRRCPVSSSSSSSHELNTVPMVVSFLFFFRAFYYAGVASNGGFGAHGVAVGSLRSAVAVGGITGSTTFASTVLASVGLEDAMAWKVSQDGVHQWAVRGGGVGNDRLHDAASDGAGGIIAAGVSFSTTATFG